MNTITTYNCSRAFLLYFISAKIAISCASVIEVAGRTMYDFVTDMIWNPAIWPVKNWTYIISYLFFDVEDANTNGDLWNVPEWLRGNKLSLNVLKPQ